MYFLFEIFNQSFLQKAFLAGTLLALVGPLIGQYMVVRRYSGITDGISHIAVLGLAIGLILGLYPSLTASIVAVLAVFLIEFLRSKNILFGETAIVLITVTCLSILSIIQQTIGFKRPLESLLFGSLFSVQTAQIWYLLALALVVYVLVVIFYKQLFNLVLNENLAKTNGIKIFYYNYLLLALTAIIVAFGINLLGGLLISGLMILPVASSFQLKKGFKTTHFISVLIGIVGVWVGLILAWFLNFPPGACIVLTLVFIFLFLLGFNKNNNQY